MIDINTFRLIDRFYFTSRSFDQKASIHFFLILLFIFCIWMFVNCIKRPDKMFAIGGDHGMLIWVLFIVITGELLIGAILD